MPGTRMHFPDGFAMDFAHAPDRSGPAQLWTLQFAVRMHEGRLGRDCGMDGDDEQGERGSGDGWMGGWVGGWVGGIRARSEDLKKVTFQ